MDVTWVKVYTDTYGKDRVRQALTQVSEQLRSRDK